MLKERTITLDRLKLILSTTNLRVVKKITFTTTRNDAYTLFSITVNIGVSMYRIANIQVLELDDIAGLITDINNDAELELYKEYELC